jgi:hypothetical protein
MSIPIRLSILIAAAMVLLYPQPVAKASGLVAIPAVLTGDSPDHLGTWTVHYQRVDGDDRAVADAINDRLDAEANRQVQQATWDGSTKHPWTFDSAGTLVIGPATVSEVFVSNYDTAEPHMPTQSVSSTVIDSSNGNPITWDSLFVDKQVGLARLGERTADALAAVAPPNFIRDWRRQGQFAPLDINFKAWAPTVDGIQLHFPEYQYGAGVKSVSVPWSALADLVQPDYRSVMAR